MKNSENIIDKIKKLLAKSESSEKLGSLEEAETFAKKAQQLLQKYNLTRADLTEEEAYKDVDHIELPCKIPGIGGSSSFDVLVVIARFNFCNVFFAGNKGNNKMVIVGNRENMEVCEYIHSVIIRVCMEVGKLEYKNYVEDFTPDQNSKTGKPVGFDTYMRTFFKGARVGLNQKLSAEQEVFKSENENSTGLMKMNDIVVSNYINEKFGSLKTSNGSRVNATTNAFQKGLETGKNVKINKGVAESKPIKRRMLN